MVSSIEVNPMDTVFLFYFGHGTRVDENSHFPILKTKQDVKYTTLLNILLEKNPRLLIAIADACNTPTDFSESSLPVVTQIANPDFSKVGTPEMANAYLRLFVEATGTLIVSSASPNQAAYYDPELGGLYTNLIVNWLKEASKHYRPSWNLGQNQLFQPIVFTDVFDASELEQFPLVLFHLKDLISIHSREKIHVTDDMILDKCDHDTGLLFPPQDQRDYERCYSKYVGINSKVYFELTGDLPNREIPFISERGILSIANVINSDNSEYELMGVAHRYFHGDGAIKKSTRNAKAMLEKAFEKGNSYAAYALGVVSYDEFKQTNDIVKLETALNWYNKGYLNGDIDSGVSWAKYSVWYATEPEIVRNALPVLLHYRDSYPEVESFIADACERGFEEAC